MIKKKKILFVCSENAPGMIPFAANIIRIISLSDTIEVFAIVVNKGKRNYNKFLLNIPNADIVQIESPSNKLFNLFSKIYNYKVISKISKLAAEKNIEILHFLTGDFSINLAIPYLNKKYKLIFTVHDLTPHETMKKPLTEAFLDKYIQWGNKRNLLNIDHLVTCSKNQYENLKNLYNYKKLFYHSFPSLITNEILSGTDYCPELKNIDKYILFFGNIDVYKGVHLLYEAYLNAKEINQNYFLVIAGQGERYYNIENELNSRIVNIERFVKDSEIKKLFQDATCVIYPYISATQSGVLSLSYIFETPLAASNIPFFSQNIVDGVTGLLFERGSVIDLTKKMIALISETDLVQMKIQQKNYYLNNYSETVLHKELEDMYYQIYDYEIK